MDSPRGVWQNVTQTDLRNIAARIACLFRKWREIRRPEVKCVTPSGPAFTSRTAKKRAKDKVTPTLPKLPRKKAEVVQTLADSPGTKRILEKRGFLQSSSERQDTQ